MTTQTADELLRENEELRRRLEEAESTIRALRAGEVDAVLIENGSEQVYTLETPHKAYQLLVAQVPHPAATLTPDGTIIACNPLFADLLQRPLNSLPGHTVRDLVAPDSWVFLQELLRAGQAGEVQGEVTLLRGDGSPVPAHLGISPLNEGALGSCLILTDLTERRQYEELRKAQEALRAASERLELAQQAGHIGTFEWDMRADHLIWSATQEELYGFRSHGSGQAYEDWKRVVHPEDLARAEADWRRAMEARTDLENEFRIIRPDGQVRWLANKARFFYDDNGQPVRLLGVNIDITNLKRTEEALRESQNRLASELAAAERLQEISTSLIGEGDGGHLYDRILDAARAIMGSDMASMQLLHPERNELELLAHQGFHPGSADFWKWVRFDSATSCAVALRTGQRVIVRDVESADFVVAEDLVHYRRSGIRGIQSTPLVSRDGRLVGMLSTHWRTTHEPSEHDLRLLDVLARQAADLIERGRAEQALRRADQRKDEFLATLAHEMRSPLAPIRHALEILIAKGPANPELQAARRVIDRQLAMMTRLLEDLLDVSRIARNKLELRRERTQLAEVIDSALETSRPLFEAAGHSLTLDLPDDPVWLNADPVRLAQVFANLLTNAAKYTEHGGQITLRAERQGSDLVVSVRDTGIGIPAEVLPRIFDIFAQSPRALERAQGGLGIGLSLVKGLVELHGGSITAQSEGAGRGSEFVVRLPLDVMAARHPEPARPRPAGARAPKLKRRILVVDDNADSTDTLAQLLTILGHEVGTAYDGEQAVALAGSMRPEVVLLDIGMPKLNGYEACRRIRQQDWGRDMVVIALTGWGQEEDRRRTQEAGFNHHLVKPVDPAALTNLLASLPNPAAARS